MQKVNFQSIGKLVRNSGIAILAANSLFSGKVVQAQVNLSPLSIDVDAKANKARGVIDIQNASNNEFRARIYAEPFTYDRNSGFKTLTSTPTDLRPYLQFSPQEVNLPQGGLRRVRMTVNLPQNLPDGEYRAMIFTEPLVDLSAASKASGTTVVNRIGTAFYVRKGNIKPNLSIDSLTWNQDANKLQLLVRNSGKASIQTIATWTVSQNSKVVRTGDSPSATVIAEGDRYLLMQTGQVQTEPLSAGNYQVTGTLTSGRETKQTQNFNFTVTVPPIVKKVSRPNQPLVKP
jgi:hypothetical protein